MATLVHLADEKEIESIKKNGIKIGKNREGVYCMPVLPDFYTSHQWLRELKRCGVRTCVAVYFKIDNKTKVYAGHYLGGHQYIELSKAIKEIKFSKDPLGYELIVDRKIEPKEISKIKHLPQITGWRVYPSSKGRKPCACDYCIRGTINANKIRVKSNQPNKAAKIKRILKKKGGDFRYYKFLEDLKESSNYGTANLLVSMRENLSKPNSNEFAFFKKSDPKELRFLLEKNSIEAVRELAIILKYFEHQNTKKVLLELLEEKDSPTMENATNSLLELYGDGVVETIEKYEHLTIQQVLKEYKENQSS